MKYLKNTLAYLSIQLTLFGFSVSLFAGNNNLHQIINSQIAPPSQTITNSRTIEALVIFAAFKDQPQDELPSWTQDIFKPNVQNSLTHYYNVQSNGKHFITGNVINHWVYADFNCNSPEASKEKFISAILKIVDQEIDFSLYDTLNETGEEKPDGITDLMIFINIAESKWFSKPFLNSGEFTSFFDTNDNDVKICSKNGTTQLYQSQFVNQIGIMAHEYAHTLGLHDLYDLSYFYPNHTSEDYSAGIGLWGLMSEGYGVWGLYSLSEFCKSKLGWVSIKNITSNTFDLKVEPCIIYKVQPASFPSKEYFLISYRDHTNCYDEKLPSGLLIWHIDERQRHNRNELHKIVDLECADGLYTDSGQPNPISGRDNLDFWAKRDYNYTMEHNGNTFDATDPFDGKRFTSFTPYTNPNSNGYDGEKQDNVSQLAITNIRPNGICDVIFNYWEGKLTQNTTWSSDDHPIYLGGDVFVPRNLTLTINAGTDIKYNGYSIITDDGGFRRKDLISKTNELDQSNYNQQIPNTTVLHQNYPNPFNPSTKINFTLDKNSYVELKIYNILGEEIQTLLSRQIDSGEYSINFDGHGHAPGTYFYTLLSDDFTKTKKMTLIE